MSEVVLDLESFKALASETRVGLLKALKERGKTASELAREKHISVQAAATHLEKMASAGLVERRKRSKWVYYDLTEKGRGVLEPSGKNVWLVLGASLLAIAAGAWRLSTASAEGALPSPVSAETSLNEAPALAAQKVAEAYGAAPSLDGWGVLLVVAGALGVGFALRELSRRWR